MKRVQKKSEVSRKTGEAKKKYMHLQLQGQKIGQLFPPLFSFEPTFFYSFQFFQIREEPIEKILWGFFSERFVSAQNFPKTF
jgi:hypothetical protein